jgi:hypothetical protein
MTEEVEVKVTEVEESAPGANKWRLFYIDQK